MGLAALLAVLVQSVALVVLLGVAAVIFELLFARTFAVSEARVEARSILRRLDAPTRDVQSVGRVRGTGLGIVHVKGRRPLLIPPEIFRGFCQIARHYSLPGSLTLPDRTAPEPGTPRRFWDWTRCVVETVTD